jgi:hypothetical protein
MTESATASDKIVNRHMARLLSSLEEAECPGVFVRAVKAGFAWLRDDLRENERTTKGTKHNENGTHRR